MLRLELRSGYGLVAVAARRIEPGTVLARERPMALATDSTHGRLVSQMIAFAALPSCQRTRLLALFYRGDQPPEPVVLAAAVRAAELPASNGLGAPALAEAGMIWRLNGHEFGPGLTGLFPVLCLLSHSCRPNTAPEAEGPALCSRACRLIEPGEQLTASYLGQTNLFCTAIRREQLQRQYQFGCRCERCESSGPVPPAEPQELQVLRFVRALDDPEAELDSRLLAELFREAVDRRGPTHWTAGALRFVVCEATVALEQAEPGSAGQLVGGTLGHLAELYQWLQSLELHEGAGYYLGALVRRFAGLESSAQLDGSQLRILDQLVAEMPDESDRNHHPTVQEETAIKHAESQLEAFRRQLQCSG